MLYGVAGFVGGNTQGGKAVSTVVFLAQDQPLAGRVIMVGKVPAGGSDFNICDASLLQDIQGGLTARDPAAGAYARPLAVGAADFRLGVHAQNGGGND